MPVVWEYYYGVGNGLPKWWWWWRRVFGSTSIGLLNLKSIRHWFWFLGCGRGTDSVPEVWEDPMVWGMDFQSDDDEVILMQSKESFWGAQVSDCWNWVDKPRVLIFRLWASYWQCAKGLVLYWQNLYRSWLLLNVPLVWEDLMVWYGFDF